MLCPQSLTKQSRRSDRVWKWWTGPSPVPQTKNHIGKGSIPTRCREGLGKICGISGHEHRNKLGLRSANLQASTLNRFFLRSISLLNILIPAEDSTSTTCPSFSSKSIIGLSVKHVSGCNHHTGDCQYIRNNHPGGEIKNANPRCSLPHFFESME